MKKLFPILMVLCWACQPDEASPADRFVRSYGLQGNSSLNDVIELENGNLLLCGKMAKPAFNSNLNSDNSSGNLEESAPALILTDAEGQLLEYRLYPIQSVEKDPIINISRLAGSASFLEIQALDNGGYLAAGEFRGFGFNVGINAPEPEPEARNTIPFLARFNANLELVEFTNFNGIEPWDGFFYSSGVLQAKPDGSGFVFMVGFNFQASINRFVGFSLYDLDAQGKIVARHDLRTGSTQQFARDFCFLNDGSIAVVGQRGKNYTYFKINPQTYAIESRINLGPDGTNETFNNNFILIEATPQGGSYCFYTDPVEINYHHGLDQLGNTLFKDDLEPERIDNYPINSRVCSNGDVLLSCIDLENPMGETGRVYRLAPDGSVVWTREFEGRVLRITEAKDGSIFILADHIYSGGNRKSTFYKMNSHAELY